MKNENTSAFPTPPPVPNGLTGEEYGHLFGSEGLTKREWFAGMAMQGLLVNYKANGDTANVNYPHVSELAIMCADEILKQLENPTSK